MNSAIIEVIRVVRRHGVVDGPGINIVYINSRAFDVKRMKARRRLHIENVGPSPHQGQSWSIDAIDLERELAVGGSDAEIRGVERKGHEEPIKNGGSHR